MDPTFLLVGAAAFLLAKKKNTGAEASKPESSAPPKEEKTVGKDYVVSDEARASLIRRLYDNSIPNFDFVNYAFTISQPESGGKYRPYNKEAADKGYPLGMNQVGFIGIYQVGAQGMEDQGFIKRGTWATPGTGGNYKIFTTKANWTDKCPGGLEQFLNSPELQEAAFVGYTKANYRGLKRYKVITDDSPAAERAGYLSAAHLKGVGGAIALKNKVVLTDGNGTPTDRYYRLGARSQGGRVA